MIRALTASSLILFALFAYADPAHAQNWSPEMDRAGLQQALDQYGNCNASCSADLSVNLLDHGIDQATDFVAALTAAAKGKKVAMVAFYQLARRSYERAEKVTSSYGACSSKCDALYSDIVVLGRAGLLGPMLRDGQIDPATFQNQQVLDVYMKYIVPIPPDSLPWQFYNDDWAKKLENTA